MGRANRAVFCLSGFRGCSSPQKIEINMEVSHGLGVPNVDVFFFFMSGQMPIQNGWFLWVPLFQEKKNICFDPWPSSKDRTRWKLRGETMVDLYLRLVEFHSALLKPCTQEGKRTRINGIYDRKHIPVSYYVANNISGWWFGTFFIFPYIGLLIIPID